MRMSRHVLFAVLMAAVSTAFLGAQSLISYTEGRVTVTRDGRTLDGSIGFSLAAGDTIATGSDSLAVLELENRGTLKLQADTVLDLADLGENMTVKLSSGGLFSRIRRLAGTGYGVSASNVAAAVRGTEFFVAYGQQIEETPDLWLCVNEGAVEVTVTTTGDSVLVNEGEGINILAGNRLTDPRFFEWTRDLNWNTDPAAGNLRNEADLSGAYTDLRDFDYD